MSSDSECAGIRGYIDPSWPRPIDDDSACIIIYGYVPSLALCSLGLILFFLALLAHSWLLIKYRTWYFSTVVVGLTMELVGYIGRILSSQKNPYSVKYFVIQYFFVVTAPVMFSAAIYTIVSVSINRIGREYAPFRPRLILWIFILCDVIATVIQVVGAALIGVAESNGKDPTTPNNILLAGLAFQVFSFFMFILCFSAFFWQSRKVTTTRYKIFAAATFVATIAVYLRTCFRLAETAEGLLEYLSTHEVFFGCLEFLPIVIAVYIFIYWHPGKWLGSQDKPGKALESRGMEVSHSSNK